MYNTAPDHPTKTTEQPQTVGSLTQQQRERNTKKKTKPCFSIHQAIGLFLRGTHPPERLDVLDLEASSEQFAFAVAWLLC